MTSAMITLAVIFWLTCSILAYSGWLAATQREFPTVCSKWDFLFCALFSLAGPIALLVVFFMTNFFLYGLQFIAHDSPYAVEKRKRNRELRDYYWGGRNKR